MTRRYVAQLAHQEQVREVFLASNKQLRPNRNGNLYLQLELSDRSGSISARMWNATEQVYNSFDDGQFIEVDGVAQIYQGAMQLIAKQITKVPADLIDPAEFTPLDTVDIDHLSSRLAELLRSIKDPHLAALVECFLMDEAFMARFSRSPAGVKNHHAYRGGLIEHVVNLMEVVQRISDRYPMLDADLLLMGAFLHDVGKVAELEFEPTAVYTDEGQLLGHLVLAISILDTKVAEAERLSGEPMPHETVLRLKHMIVSHHGTYEFGSPKLPMTLEAVALHHLDNLDAKIHSFHQLMREDANVDSSWTTYHPTLGRKLFKSHRQDEFAGDSSGQTSATNAPR